MSGIRLGTRRWMALVSVAGAAWAATSAGTSTAGAPPTWLTDVDEQVRQGEYELTWQGKPVLPDLGAAWQAPNRAQNLRTYFTEQGIVVIPRTDEATPAWRWELSLFRWGRPGAWQSVEVATREAVENRIGYRRGAIVESYVNDSKGLEQKFEILARPAASLSPERSVYVDLRLGGTLSALVAEDGQSIDFVTGTAARAIQYDGLVVTDARGRLLPSRMEAFSDSGIRGIRLVYDDTEAVYPVLIDPLATSPGWTTESNQVNAYFGRSVSTAGDVNGDGYSDVSVGAYNYDNGQMNEGRVYVYYGSSTGLSTSAAWTMESNQTSAIFGWSVNTAGDVNGDGFADVIIGAPWYDNDQSDEGRAFVYLGSSSGLASSPVWTAEGNQVDAQFAYAVAPAADVNGDGYGDVIVGAPTFNNGQGHAEVYHGSSSGPSTNASWSKKGEHDNDQFGLAVATAGDVNGDGFADVIIGAPLYDNGQTDEGRVYVYHGSLSGLSTDDADATFEENQAGARYGAAVSTAGDVNGDGYADVLAGAPGYDHFLLGADAGMAHVIHGSSSGLSTHGWSMIGQYGSAQLGFAVAPAGDFNGDGYGDVLVCAPFSHGPPPQAGKCYAVRGSRAGPGGGQYGTWAWSAGSNQESALFGVSAAPAGDVNGDGYADIIIGIASFDNGQTNEGRAAVYLGSNGGFPATSGWVTDAVSQGVAGTGDFNGDGFADLIKSGTNDPQDNSGPEVYYGSSSGLPLTRSWYAPSPQANSLFGAAVANAGDVNGDGYDDLIVGAALYDNGQTDEGRAFLYLGSSSGLATTAAWTAESNSASAQFATTIAGAGDVNDDGYADVVIGAPKYTNGQTEEGRAYLYLGSQSGLATSPVWMAETNQAGANFGASVASASDVNRDGYSDVAIGAPNAPKPGMPPLAGAGRVYVYHGSLAGLGASAQWTRTGAHAGEKFGSAVTSAGDSNGDGYADLLVGSPFYSNGEAAEGRTTVYLGSSTGLVSLIAWAIEGNYPDAYLGAAVSGAGDVNGDGYTDVVVGAPGYDYFHGKAEVYLGSTSGLASTAAWTEVGYNYGDFANLGRSVGAGDVNADGYSDIFAWHRLDGKSYGLVYGLYGGETPALEPGQPVSAGVSPNPRQLWAGSAHPLAHLGHSNEPDAFDLAIRGQTPFGYGLVRLESEVKPVGTKFDGEDTQVSDAVGADVGTGAIIVQTVTHLGAETAFHWRVRLRFSAVLNPFCSPHSRWMTPPRNGWEEEDFRTAE